MRDYFLDPRRCSVYIDPAPMQFDVTNIDILAITNTEFGLDEVKQVLSAMQAGIPVVLPRTRLASRIVANGITGLLYNNPAELYSTIEYLTNDPMLREEIGLAARNVFAGDSDLYSVLSFIMDLGSLDADAKSGKL